MKVLTLIELRRMNRAQLCGLLSEIAVDLNNQPEGSLEHNNALTNLHQIRWALARGDFAP